MNTQYVRPFAFCENKNDNKAADELWRFASGLRGRGKSAARLMNVVKFLRDQGLEKQAKLLEGEVKWKIMFAIDLEHAEGLSIPPGHISDCSVCTKHFRSLDFWLNNKGGRYCDYTFAHVTQPFQRYPSRDQRRGNKPIYGNEISAGIAKSLANKEVFEKLQAALNEPVEYTLPALADTIKKVPEGGWPTTVSGLQDMLGRPLTLLENHVFRSAKVQGLARAAGMAICREDILNYERQIEANRESVPLVPYFVGVMWCYCADPDSFCQEGKEELFGVEMADFVAARLGAIYGAKVEKSDRQWASDLQAQERYKAWDEKYNFAYGLTKEQIGNLIVRRQMLEIRQGDVTEELRFHQNVRLGVVPVEQTTTAAAASSKEEKEVTYEEEEFLDFGSDCSSSDCDDDDA